jgi:hypothetical protein
VIEIDVGRFDRQFAPIRHGISRIDRQIEQRVFKLVGIDQNWPHAGREHCLHANTLTQGALTISVMPGIS